MFRILFLLSVLIQSGISSDRSTRIAGGIKVTGENEYKFLVSLQNGTNHFCSGVIIKPNAILTSASCVEPYKGKPDIIRVVVNTLSILPNKGMAYKVGKIIQHPKYNRLQNENNVAVIKLNVSISTNYGTSIEMLPQGSIVTEKLGIISGWGKTQEDDFFSNDLLETTVTIIDNPLCEKYMSPSKVTNNMICTYDLNKDACEGDEGGPLLIHRGGRKLAGIVSWGMGCAYTRKARVYANIPSFYSDIMNMAN